MKRSRLEIAILVVVASILTLDALIVASHQKLNWTTFAQAYEVPASVPGVVQQGGNAIVDMPDGNTLTLTSFGPDGTSNETLQIDMEELASLPDNSDEAQEVASTSDGYVVLYKLPASDAQASNFQVNIGPDKEGKIFVYVFEINPFRCVSRYLFTTTDPTHQFEGSC